MEWRPAKGYEQYYEINNIGEIRSYSRTHETIGRFGKMNRKCGGRILKTHTSNSGYTMSEFNINRKMKKINVHRLVYETFIGEIFDKNIIHHIDQDKSNNSVNNLIQMNYIEHNNIHSHEAWNKGSKTSKETINKSTKKRKENYIPKCKKAFELRNQGHSIKEISKILTVCERQVLTRIKQYKELSRL